MSRGDPSILVTRPIAVTILILAALTTITGIRRQRKALRQQAAMEAAASGEGAQG
jgi:TctA family transporter